MAQYYFTVASLPMLFYEVDSYPSSKTLIDLCRQQVSLHDAALLYDIAEMTVPKKDTYHSFTNSTFRRWAEWEISLLTELSNIRAQSLGWESDFVFDSDLSIATEEIAREAAAQESPLTGEEILNRARWAYLDEIEVGHYFTIDRLIIYLLKIKILERKARFIEPLGQKGFDTIYSGITEHNNGNG